MQSTAEQGHEALFPLAAGPTAFPVRSLGSLVGNFPRESAMQAQHAVEVSRTQCLVFGISHTRC